VLHEDCDVPRLRTATELRTFALRCRERFDAAQKELLNLFANRIGEIARLCLEVADRLSEREQIVSSPLTSAATELVQAGLFDRRAIRASEEQRDRDTAATEEARQHLAVLESHRHLVPSLDLRAILLVDGRSRS
jgi:hypothetical protein